MRWHLRTGIKPITMKLLATGVNHTTAEVELRELLSFPEGEQAQALQDLQQQPGIREAALLSTCNRTELYCLVEDEEKGGVSLAQWLAKWHKLPLKKVESALYHYEGALALRHMMRVAGGLNSLVLGEPQILGQMRDAYSLSRESKTIGSELDQTFQHVFSVAKAIRTDTAIGENPVSVAYAAVSLARHIFADLAHSRALLIGAGEMIQLVVRHLVEQGVTDITIANRTVSRAQALASTVNGKGISLEELPEALVNADIVIACTGSPHTVIEKEIVARALKRRKHKPIFMVDIAVPRDVAPSVRKLQDVYLYSVDDLQQAIAENVRQREAAAKEAEAIIDRAVEGYARRLREREAVPSIRRYRSQVAELGQTELSDALALLKKGKDPETVLQRFEHRLTRKIMHQPSVTLREFAADSRQEALQHAEELLLEPTSKSTES